MGSGYSSIRKSKKLQHSDKEVLGLGIEGTRLISCGNELKVWELKTGECLHVLKGHKERIFAAKLQGETLAYSASADRNIKIWSLTDGSCVRTLSGHSREVLDIAVNGDHLFSCSADSTIRQWDIEAGTLIREFTGHTGAVHCLGASEKRLASGGLDTTVRIWDTESGKDGAKCSVLTKHTGPVTCVSWVDNFVGSGSTDLTICLWDTSINACSRQFDAGGNVRALDSVQNYLVAGLHVASISIFDVEKRKHLKTISSQRTSWLEALVCNTNYLVTGDKRGVLRVYEYEGKLNRQIGKENNPIVSASSAPPSPVRNKPEIVISSDVAPSIAYRSYTDSPTRGPRKILAEFSTPTKKDPSTPKKRDTPSRETPTKDIKGTPAKETKGTPTRSGFLRRISDRKTLPASAPTTPMKKAEPEINLTLEAELLVLPPPAAARPTASAPTRRTSSSPRKGRRTSVDLHTKPKTGRRGSIESEKSSVYSLPFGDDGGSETSNGSHLDKKKTIIKHGNSVFALELTDHTIISGGADNNIKIWNIENNELVQSFQGHKLPIVSLSMNGNILASGSCDKTLKLWDIGKSKWVTTLEHKDEVSAVLYKNNQLLSASLDKTIKLWDVEKTTCLQQWTGHTDGIKSIDCFENLLVSASLDKTVRIWDLRSKECLHVNKYHGGPVNTISFTNEGDSVISGSSDMSVCVWDVKLAVVSHKLTTEGNVRSLCVNGSRLIVGSYVGSIKVFEIERGRVLKTYTSGGNWLETLKSNDSVLITGDRKGDIRTFTWGAEGAFFSKFKQKLSGLSWSSLSKPSSRRGSASEPDTPLLEPQEPHQKDLSFIMEDEREADFGSFSLTPQRSSSSKDMREKLTG